MLFISFMIYLNAQYFDSVSGEVIEEDLSTSCRAKLIANDRLVYYANIYNLLIDKDNLGLYDLQKYDPSKKSYVKISQEEISKARKNLEKYLEIKRIVYEKRYYPMGKKIYKKKCQKKGIDVEDYIDLADLKSELKWACNIKDKTHLQAVALYMWDVLRDGGVIAKEKRIHVNKDEKCPVCGMYVYKYPKWAAQIFYKNSHTSHDGVKDLMKWYFDHKEGIKKILVSDYYSRLAIDGKKAFYVIGSDVHGPMGHELIPFESKKDAEVFLKDHRAKRVIKFEEITKEMVYALDKGKFL